MKLITAMTTASIVTVVGLVTLLANSVPNHTQREGGIEVIKVNVTAAQNHLSLVSEHAIPASRPSVSSLNITEIEQADAGTSDGAALDALFASQVRDPSWAPGAEAEIRSSLAAGTRVNCAAFMCRVAVQLTNSSNIRSFDQQAYTMNEKLPAGLSYNRFTAGISHDKDVQLLVFYVTRVGAGMP